MSAGRLRIGVLGAGHLGRIHLQQALTVDDFEVVGFHDPDPDKCTAIRSEFGLPALGSVDAVIEAADVVDVVTPTLSHHGCAMQAMARGRHVFIEKPLANTLVEGLDLVRMAEDTGLCVQVGHVERFNPAFQAAVPSLKEPLFIEGHRLAQFNPRGTDVPVILDLMVHDLDLVLSTVRSTVTAVHASGVAVVSDSPDIANARIEFANGCVANLTASRISLKNMRKMRFFQRDAYISVDMLTKETEIVRMEAVVGDPDPFAITLDLGGDKGKRAIQFEKPEVPSINAIREELRSFAASVRAGTSPTVTIQDGFAALELAHRILERMHENLRRVGPDGHIPKPTAPPL
ncbi:MAG: Gfo/Idh/MocA family oxidoreductase [Flavobacteriales bacterium]|nr:Gfo/Idh/MocA family oxidoreductase [Flavobacteriales bacterium]MBK8947664.1 Gfo/Idh/MocA family oxidoreductase [Flavobacteriales bacterium]MBK9700399.1 Gfo/Idh/MocA family oxidoreductase [Flavobacteriales bacterium]